MTICAYNREYLFGSIIDGEMECNRNGEIVKNEWTMTEKLRCNVKLDANEIELNKIRQYIKDNPRKWQYDNYYV